MDVLQALESLPGELERFASELDACVKTSPSRRHLRSYLAGQIGERPRKSVEPIALAAGVAPRTLQAFLASHRWDDQGVESCLQARIARDHGARDSIAIVDETSFPKKGDCTPGVKRQHCGATGKVDNCLVTVHVGYVAGDFHALLGGEPFVPEDWLADEDRCRKAGIPEGTAFRTKWRIALDLTARAAKRGVRPRWLCADEYYGRAHEFRLGVADLDICYVVEVPCNLTGRVAGRDPAEPARRFDELWERGGPSWQRWHVKDTTKGPAVWEVRAVRVRVTEEEIAGEEQWLVIARNALNVDEVKYFLSNAPADTPLATLLHVAFCRWHVERLFQESKTEVGLDHYEGRTWLGLVRHLVLTGASILFLAEQRKRLRRLRGEGTAFTLEQVKLATEVQMEPGVPSPERRRRLARALEIIRYHQKRNEVARRSHTKTRLRLLAAKGIDPAAIERCPVAL
jgi:SRSO17 transposase